MDIAVGQGMKSLEILDLVDLETDIGIRVNRGPSSSPQVNYLVISLFDPVKLYPCNVVFEGVRMRCLMTYNHTNNVLPFLVSLIYRDCWNVLLPAFVLPCFDDFWKIHVIPLSQVSARIVDYHDYSHCCPSR